MPKSIHHNKSQAERDFFLMKKVYGMIMAVLCLSNLFAYEFTVKATPTVILPFLSGGNAKYAPFGYGAFLDGGFNLFDVVNIGPEFGFLAVPKQNSSKLREGVVANIYSIPIGVQAGTYFYPFSRVEIGVGLAGGANIFINDSKSHYAPWYRVYGEANFRINPSLSVGFNTSWFDAQNNTWFGNPALAGITAGVSVRYKFDTQKVSGNVEGTVAQNESVFPLLYTIYKENPFGTVTIENNETAEIRNVVVKFRSENYTASEIECGSIKLIKKHQKEDVPLYADFSESILQFTESGKISGELVITYELLGKQRVAVSQVTIPVYNRNQVRWMDPSSIASYISAKSQEVLEFSKYSVGIARNHLRSGLNRNMQFAMYLQEAIRLSGIKYENNSDTPYNLYHSNDIALDYIQYPYQTIAYKSGDVDDLAILYMAMLESVGISAAFMPFEDDVIVAFNLGVDASKASTLFDGYDRILVVDDQIWIPVSMASLKEGFMNSWYKAILEIQDMTEREEDFDFIIVSDAWTAYPPAGFSNGDITASMPAEKALTTAVETDISRYITAEFGPQIAGIQNRIKKEGASVTLYNQLGILYVRAGMYSSAIPVYELSAKMGSVSAMNNLGNICTLQKKYQDAKKWYEMALSVDPNNATANRNLERIITELEK